jgi:hypothetical protein
MGRKHWWGRVGRNAQGGRMSMTGYCKLFSCIVASTIWREPSDTCKVWITMLALADRDGIIEASMPGLAHLARVSIEAMQTALTTLESPDPYSRSPEFEGRRIERIRGGWKILNYEAYREKCDKEEAHRKHVIRQQRYRERLKSKEGEGMLTHVDAPCDGGGGGERERKEGSVREENQPLPREAQIWNSCCGTLPKVEHVGAARLRHLEAKRKDPYWVKNFEAAVKKAAASDFCCGKNDRGWVATFDFLVERQGKLEALMEGKYDNRSANGRRNHRLEGVCRASNDEFEDKFRQLSGKAPYREPGQMVPKVGGTAHV